MGYVGYKPADKPLTSADITDSIITSAKIVDGTIVNADINASAAIATSKFGAGSVLQVIQTTSSTQVSSTSTTYTDVGISASITPSSSSNKILIIFSCSSGNSTSQESKFNIVRGSTGLSTGDGFSYTYDSAGMHRNHVNIAYLDSPSTTSSTTYKMQYKTGSGGTVYAFHASTQGSLLLFEIAG